jgi:hypothetical protein
MYNLLRLSQSFLLVSSLVAAGSLIVSSPVKADSVMADENGATNAAIAPETEFEIADFESLHENHDSTVEQAADDPIASVNSTAVNPNSSPISQSLFSVETDSQTDSQTNSQTNLQHSSQASPVASVAEHSTAASTPASTESVVAQPIDQSVTQPIAQSTVAPRDTQVEVLANPPADSQGMAQLTSVSQLSDVQPTDWAFQALQSLVERYGVIAGYPDGTFRGNRALTRYEFAAGLNAALDRVNELIAAGLAETVTREDLATLQRLQEEFAAELATLRGRVDVLEARTAELEANQFSTTTVLNGEVIFGLVSVIDGNNANDEPIDRNPTFGYRVRLNLETSFTGEDLLTTRFQANNIVPLGGTNSGVLQTNEGRVEFDGDSDNEFQLGLLRYRFPLGDRTNIYLAATGNGFVDLDASAQLTPYLDGSAVSLFALRNPIYNYSSGAGFGIRHFLTDDIEINLGYLVPDAGNPEPGSGLFNGKYGALAQAIFYGFDQRLRIGLSYINSYTPSDEFFGPATGSNLANETFDRPVSVNSYGVSGTFTLTPGLAMGGWVGYSNHRYIGRGDGDVWTWAASVAFPDLGGEGNLGGILVGMEPRLTEIDESVNGGETDPDTSLHLEAYYKYRLSDNIEITPGVIWLTAPNHDADNDDAIIGVLRTVFRF